MIFCNCFLPGLIGSAADRGAVYLAGTYRSVGRGWPTGYLLPDSCVCGHPALLSVQPLLLKERKEIQTPPPSE